MSFVRKLPRGTIFQCILTALGIITGIYFSRRSNDHDFTHKDLDFHSSMDHGFIDISKDSVIPEIENLELFKDKLSGWNIHLKTKNFRFAPESANSKHIPGQGHAHLLINGNKVARIYSNWFHIPEMDVAINELEVTLNANSHAIMMFNNRTISVKLTSLKSEKKSLPMCKG